MLKWLRNNTLGTFLLTRRRGERVGEDSQGNSYYREPGAMDWRRERRWVVYKEAAEIEASMVPPGWNAWLHHNRERAPAPDDQPGRRWEKPHLPNLSGTPAAYVPPGHVLRGGQRAPATGDYEAWRPE